MVVLVHRYVVQVRDLMKRHYYVVRCVFKNYCAIDNGEPFSVGWNAFTTLMTSIGIPDDQCKLDVRTVVSHLPCVLDVLFR